MTLKVCKKLFTLLFGKSFNLSWYREPRLGVKSGSVSPKRKASNQAEEMILHNFFLPPAWLKSEVKGKNWSFPESSSLTSILFPVGPVIWQYRTGWLQPQQWLRQPKAQTEAHKALIYSLYTQGNGSWTAESPDRHSPWLTNWHETQTTKTKP